MHLRREIFFVIAQICLCAACYGLEDPIAPKRSDEKAPAPEVTPVPPVDVTAPRVSNPPDKISSSTVVTEDEIIHATIQHTGELSRRVPNVTFVEAGDRRTGNISIRGVIGNTYGSPIAITYIDDVPLNDWEMFIQDLYDVDQLTVIRGPHAETTHGASAEIGLIQIYTKQPGNEYEGDARVSYGNYNAQFYRAAVGGPIIKDKLMFRFSALEARRDGFLTNTVRDSHPDYRTSLSGRLQLKYLPTPEFEVSLTAEGQHAVDGTQTYTSLHAPDPFKVTYNEPGHLRLDTYMGALKLAYTTNDFVVSSITSRRSFETDDQRADLDFTPAPLFNFAYEYDFVQWSQEFRLQSKNSDKWNWLAGAYFEDKGTNSFFGNRIDDTAFIQAPAPGGLGLPFTKPLGDFRHSHLFGQAYALFGQATYKISDKLDVTFGLRAEWHRDEMQTRHDLFAYAQHTTVPLYKGSGDRAGGVVLPKIAASYQVKSNVSTYATIGEGYRPGGFAYLVDNPKFEEWQPEHLWNFETGVKSSWLKDKVEVNLSLYYALIDNLQVRRIANFNFRVDNADMATTRGGELEVFARPIKGLQLELGIGYADSFFNDYSDELTHQSFDGNHLIYASKYTYSLAAQYLHCSGFFVRGDINGRSSQPFDEDNSREQRAFKIVNSRVGYEKPRYGIYLFGKNIFNERYGHFGIPGPGSSLIGSPGDPRQFGIEARYSF